MHADEINRAMTEALAREVYHYHLHVVYVPVVEKQILWSTSRPNASVMARLISSACMTAERDVYKRQVFFRNRILAVGNEVQTTLHAINTRFLLIARGIACLLYTSFLSPLQGRCRTRQ